MFVDCELVCTVLVWKHCLPAWGLRKDDGSSPDAASEFNRLLQMGTASLTTKTSGAFGEGNTPTISMGLAGSHRLSVSLRVLPNNGLGSNTSSMFRGDKEFAFQGGEAILFL